MLPRLYIFTYKYKLLIRQIFKCEEKGPTLVSIGIVTHETHVKQKSKPFSPLFTFRFQFKLIILLFFFSQIICSPLFREKRGARIPTYRPTAPPPFLVGPLSPCLPLITSHKPFLLYRYVIMSSFLFHFFSFYMFNFATFAAVASCGLQTD